MKPRLALFALISLASCTAAMPTSAQQRLVPSSKTYEFSGPNGTIVIDPVNPQIEVDGKRTRLTICTNGDFYCYIAAEADFAVIFPKSCSVAEAPQWSTEQITLATVSMFPHTNVAAMMSVGHSSFMLEYRQGYGLVGL